MASRARLVPKANAQAVAVPMSFARARLLLPVLLSTEIDAVMRETADGSFVGSESFDEGWVQHRRVIEVRLEEHDGVSRLSVRVETHPRLKQSFVRFTNLALAGTLVMGAVIAEIKTALEKHEYRGELGVMGTSHNPFRYWFELKPRSWWDVFRRGRATCFHIFGPKGARPRQEQLETFLQSHSFEIWVLDFDGVDTLS